MNKSISHSSPYKHLISKPQSVEFPYDPKQAEKLYESEDLGDLNTALDRLNEKEKSRIGVYATEKEKATPFAVHRFFKEKV